MAASLRRTLPAVPSSVTALRSDVAAFVAEAGIEDPLLGGIKLAVSEAVTNVVMHAYVGAERPGEVRLRAQVRAGEVQVTVSDDGVGMVPRLDSPGLGVGLPFIAHLADALDIEHGTNGGTRLNMTFRLAVAVDRS
jgi:serine/threonine-protein kinase RsbW